MQVSYGLAGLLVLFVNNIGSVVPAFAIDVLTSAIGLVLFTKEAPPPRRLASDEDRPVSLRHLLRFPFSTSALRLLLLGEVLLCAGLGGANAMLVKYGTEFFASIGGYGAALTVYGLAVLVAGTWVAKKLSGPTNRSTAFEAVLTVVTGAAIVGCVTRWPSEVVGAVLLFTFLTAGCTAVISIQQRWFDQTPAESLASVLAWRTVLVAGVMAIGEWLYTQVEADAPVRLVLCIASATTLLAVATKMHPASHRSESGRDQRSAS